MRFKSIELNGKVITGENAIENILAERGFGWLLKCEMDDAVIKIQHNTLFWVSGTFYWGDWKYGVWVSGDWRYGQWHGGVWLSGTWYNGTWHNGVWYGGQWHKGTWVAGKKRA
jgi:hypothetical protein